MLIHKSTKWFDYGEDVIAVQALAQIQTDIFMNIQSRTQICVDVNVDLMTQLKSEYSTGVFSALLRYALWVFLDHFDWGCYWVLAAVMVRTIIFGQ